MAVKRVKYKKQRAGTRFDARSGAFVGWRIDIRRDGKRLRNKVFETRKEAENYIGKQLFDESNGLNEDELVELFIGIRSRKIGYAKFKDLWLKNYLKPR
jgi:hypothetical protein